MVEPLIKKDVEPTKGAERDKFLNRKSHPARLTVEETAWALGFSTHEIPVLVAGKLLKPLGNPAPNTVKWFAADTVEELRHDLKWLSRATDAVMVYWRDKNARKSELIIANLVYDAGRGPKYDYETPLDGAFRPGRLFPDFSFVDAAGDRVIWEHLGRMDDPDYVFVRIRPLPVYWRRRNFGKSNVTSATMQRPQLEHIIRAASGIGR